MSKNTSITAENETVKLWLEKLGNPTAEEIKAEIEEVKNTISNEKLWALADKIHCENIKVLEEYLEVLEIMLKGEDESL